MVEGFEAGPDTDWHTRINRIGAGYFRTPQVLLVDGVRAEVEVEGIGPLRTRVKVAP